MNLANRHDIFKSFKKGQILNEATRIEFKFENGFLKSSQDIPTQFGDILLLTKTHVPSEGKASEDAFITYQNLFSLMQSSNPHLGSPILAMSVSTSEFKVSKLCYQALSSRQMVEGAIIFHVYVLKNVFTFLKASDALEKLKTPLGQTQ